jgi:poly(A)-specific ribonuclease
VDTKYLFTHNCGNLNPMSSLDGIEENLRVQQTPRIETHEEHKKYVGEEMYHEAGYDSYLTARVAILLSAKLEAKGTYVPESGVNTPVTGTPNAKAHSTPKRGMNVNDNSAHLPPLDPPPPTSRFGTRNLFEALLDHNTPTQDIDITGSSFSLNPNARPFPIAAKGDGAASTPTHSRNTSKDETKGRRKHGEELKIDDMMPPFSSDFWRVYANKLRVFGTVEGLLDLDPVKAAAS